MTKLDYTTKDRDKDVVMLSKVKEAVTKGHKNEAINLIDELSKSLRTIQGLVQDKPTDESEVKKELDVAIETQEEKTNVATDAKTGGEEIQDSGPIEGDEERSPEVEPETSEGQDTAFPPSPSSGESEEASGSYYDKGEGDSESSEGDQSQ